MNIIEDKVVLVTGGAGAIGNHLVRRLLPRNRVIVVDDMSAGHECLLPSHENLLLHRRSILEEDVLKDVFRKKPDVVFHLAAQYANQHSVDYPRQDLMVNGMGTLKLLQYSLEAEVACFLFASTSCLSDGGYGLGDKEPPIATPYVSTKRLGEQYVRFFHQYRGLKAVIVRYYNCFGPGDYPGSYRGVIPNFLDLAIRGQPLVITGSATATRDYTYCENIVDGTLLAAQSTAALGGTFNIGAGVETSVVVLAERINQIAGNAAGIQVRGRRFWDTVDRRVADLREAKKILGYEPRVSLDEGLRETHDWMRRTLFK